MLLSCFCVQTWAHNVCCFRLFIIACLNVSLSSKQIIFISDDSGVYSFTCILLLIKGLGAQYLSSIRDLVLVERM